MGLVLRAQNSFLPCPAFDCGRLVAAFVVIASFCDDLVLLFPSGADFNSKVQLHASCTGFCVWKTKAKVKLHIKNFAGRSLGLSVVWAVVGAVGSAAGLYNKLLRKKIKASLFL